MEKFSALLLDGSIVFGKYPTREEVDLLKGNGYSIFVDLSTREEITWIPYSTEELFYNRHTIPDRSANVGDILVFRELIRRLAEVVQYGHKVYIHCRGGQYFGILW
jgi:protein-tyrosine phosphatase